MKMIWEPKHVAYLKKHYATTSNHTLSAHFGCTMEAVQKKARKLLLRKANENDIPYTNVLYGINGHTINFNKSTGVRGEVLPLKPLNLTGKRLVKIDHRTWVYMNPGQTVEEMIAKYSRQSLAAAF